MNEVMGNYQSLIEDTVSNLRYPLSYLSDRHINVTEWQNKTRAVIRDLMSFNPPDVPFDTQTDETYVKDGLVYTHVSYANAYGPRTEGILMRPENAAGALPGILGLHDHGGFKYYGKEKITEPKNHPEIMKKYQEHYYGGRGWASELAKRGYVVFVPDLFLWGSRKMTPESLPERYVSDILKEKPDSEKYIEAYNSFAGAHESEITKTFFEAGTSWPGIMLYDDMRAVDFLLSQPGVDAENIGCGGLSGGGLRTVFLAAMDERVKCSVCVGFMSTTAELALYKVYTHTWMLYLPGLSNFMDFSDLYSLHGRLPTMVLYDEDDELYTDKGQRDADDRLKRIYAKMGASELYRGHFFPGPHKYDIEMQEIAFKFYDEWLKEI